MKMPWTRRADEERKRRLTAEERCEEIKRDWIVIRKHKRSIDKEIYLNDWTETAISIFSRKDSKK